MKISDRVVIEQIGLAVAELEERLVRGARAMKEGEAKAELRKVDAHLKRSLERLRAAYAAAEE